MSLVDPAPPPITTAVLGVTVEEGPAPAPWSAPLHGEDGCADERAVLLPDGEARLYVADGRRILLDAPPGQRAAYDYLVYSSGRRFLQLQRGVLGLHAAVVVSPEDRCVAVIGTSGAGKTTVMVQALRQGWRLACDDTPDVVLDGGVPHVVPHARPVHLDAAALQALGAPRDAGTLIPRSGKRAVLVLQDLQVRRLDAVVILDAVAATAGRRAVGSQRLAPEAALPALAARSSMAGLALLPAYREPYVRWLGALVGSVEVTSVQRAVGSDTREQVAAVVLAPAEEGRA